MKILQRCSDRALGIIEGLPLIRRLQGESLDGAASGVLVGTLCLLVLGGALGSVNRGWEGTVIGALSGALLGLMLGGIVGAIIGMLRRPAEACAALSIELDNDDERYRPGESVSGRLQVHAQNAFKTDGANVYFICRGFYAHDEVGEAASGEPEFVRESRQYLVLQNDVTGLGTVRRGPSPMYPFSFTIPTDALPTHRGYACSIRWTLHAALGVPEREPIATRQELFVEAVAPALPSIPGGYQSTTSSDVCQLVLALSGVVCAEGDTVKARVQISPLDSFGAEEVRVVLLRIENTPQGDDHIVYMGEWDLASGAFKGRRRAGGKGTTYVWLEDEVELSGPTQFQIAEPMTYSFTLRVPTGRRPTLWTKDGRVTWKVGVVVARKEHPDIRTFHEVIVHTGVPEMADILSPGSASTKDSD